MANKTIKTRLNNIETKLHKGEYSEVVCVIDDECCIIPYLPEDHNLVIYTKAELDRLVEIGEIDEAVVPEECKEVYFKK